MIASVRRQYPVDGGFHRIDRGKLTDIEAPLR
jgi:hypothetical protein